MSDQHFGDIKIPLKIIESGHSIQNKSLVISDGMLFSVMDKNKKLEQENKQLREALNWASNGLFDLEIEDVTKKVIELRKQFNLDGGQNGN